MHRRAKTLLRKVRSQVDTVEQENSLYEDCQGKSEDVRTYFGSVELETVSDSRKRNKSLITLKIAGRDVRIKADTGAEATVIPYSLYTQITKKPLQTIYQPLKGWLAKKPIHPKGTVSLPTQYKNRKLDVLYLVVEGNFTPLLGCDACLDLEVIKFMNLQLIDTLEPHVVNSDTSRRDEDQSIFDTDPVLREYQDCFSDKPGKLPTKVHLEIDPSVPPVVHPPKKIPIALLEPAQEKLQDMEEGGIIVKVEEHTPWVSSMLVVDKRKAKDRDMNIPPSKDNVRICIDPMQGTSMRLSNGLIIQWLL